MEQIAIKAWHFRLKDYEPLENDFCFIVYINSEGKCKSEPHFSTKNFPDYMPMKEWKYFNLDDGRKAISFRYLSRYLDIIDPDQLAIAIPFFERYLLELKPERE